MLTYDEPYEVEENDEEGKYLGSVEEASCGHLAAPYHQAGQGPECADSCGGDTGRAARCAGKK